MFTQSGMKVEHFTQEDGLSHRWVHHITQDQKGFIWIATENGLCRYDGYEFQVFSPGEPNLNGRGITSVQEDKHGMLWVSRGLEKHAVIFDPNKLDFRYAKKGVDVFHPNLNLQKTISFHFLDFLPGMERVPVITGTDLDTATNISGLPDYQPLLTGIQTLGTFSLITQTAPQKIWIWNNWSKRGHLKFDRIRRKHYVYYDQKTKHWETFKINEKFDVQLANYNLPIDAEGRFWYPSFGELENQIFDFIQVPEGIPLDSWYAVRVDNRLNIWLFDHDFQLYRFDKESQEWEFFGKMPNERIVVFEDAEGTIWIGAEDGLRKIKRRKRFFETYLDKEVILGEALPFENTMSYILETKGGHIFSNRGYRFLAHISPPNQKITLIDSVTANLNPLNENQFYFRTEYALSLVQGNPFWVRKLDLPIRRMLAVQDLPNKIPLLKDNELQLIDTLSHKAVIPEQFNDLEMRYLYWDQKNQAIWSNHQAGILKINLSDLTTEYFELWGNQNLYFIRGWLLDGAMLWLATIDGLKLFDIKSRQIIKSFSVEDGLPHKTIYSIVRHRDNFWLGTHNGLSCFNPKTLKVRNFFVEDGLTHNEFNTYSAYVAKDGKIWMGGLNGLNVFNPDDLLKVKPDSARLFLTKFKKYNVKKDSIYSIRAIQSIENQSFELLPSDQSFSFQFFLNSLTNSTKNQYYWYLEGHESTWANVDEEPVASYQNVPPGNYFLRIKATDSRGNPAQNELTIPIQVIQVWYKRWWAWLSYFLTALVLSFWFYRFQVNRKLEQQEAIRLKELDAVKTKLYTNITHEFRTPLSVILGMADQLSAESEALSKDRSAKNQLENKLEVVSRNGKNLLSLVNQMLDLSKLESGKMALVLESGDVITFLKYLVESFHSFAEARQIQLHFDAELDSLNMDFDREKLQNILVNLLSNAMKFTPEGGSVYCLVSKSDESAKVDSGTLDRQKDYLSIIIKDTGIGIAKENLPHIFDRFYQADDSNTRQGEGTGIGLALVIELVKLMQGKIEVDSELNRGTEFKVWLPIQLSSKTNIQDSKLESTTQEKELHAHSLAVIQNDASPKTNRPFTDNPKGASRQQPTDQPQLLIIEDNLDVQNFIKSLLEKEYQIQTASDGDIGIKKAIESIPDIIISDVMMPQKDGFEVVETLKRDERTSHIPIILLTAKADVQSKLEGLERGADAYLAKPFDRKELKIRLQKLVELRQNLQKRYANLDFSQTLSSPDNLSHQIEDAFLKKVREIIEAHLSDAEFGTEELCKAIGMSKSQLYRKLKALTNRSIGLYIRSIRLHHALELLKTMDLTISEIAYEVGFTNLSYFSRVFTEEFGERPSFYKQQNNLK